MNFQQDNFIPFVKKVLAEQLPGSDGQLKMAAIPARLPAKYELELDPPANVRVAAVLVHLYYDSEWKLTLMERTNRGPHSGQISFPGGGVEKQDSSLVDTALREANEEVGIIPNQIEILGKLTPLYIPVSNSMAHPFVGYSEQPPNYQLDPEEVKTVVVANFADFFNPDKLKRRNLTVGNGLKLKDVPYFDINGHVVWGATAMILSEFFAALDQYHEVSS